ncbi:MAG: arabinogalactan endo-1,4-beta-galactosidase [Prevotella sp.]|nr:arabinogalactan endo-1,4-beta-galactosidase [Prevotella sp.]
MNTIRTLLAVLFSVVSPFVSAQRYVGADISMLPAYEQEGVWYMDESGNRINDVLAYMTSERVGWNAMRVRLFVDPAQASEADRRAGVLQDLDYVTQLGKRIKASGLKFLLDFHYSDSWADPGQQNKPAAWQRLSAPEMKDRLYTYTKACLQHLVANGAAPDFIQTGNEISYGMLWEEGKVDAWNDAGWSVFSSYLKQAGKACREICPNARIIIHTERAGETETTRRFCQRLADNGVDYDIIGLSYYPFWHKDLTTLSATLTMLAAAFPDKKVQIVETAYNYQFYPSGVGIIDHRTVWPASAEGQAAFISALCAELRRHDNVNGLYYWFPEENGHANSVISGWLNRGLWDNNTGKALPGLYRLKEFAVGTVNGISRQPVKPSGHAGRIYSLCGQQLSHVPDKGVYISEGNKRMR